MYNDRFNGVPYEFIDEYSNEVQANNDLYLNGIQEFLSDKLINKIEQMNNQINLIKAQEKINNLSYLNKLYFKHQLEYMRSYFNNNAVADIEKSKLKLLKMNSARAVKKTIILDMINIDDYILWQINDNLVAPECNPTIFNGVKVGNLRIIGNDVKLNDYTLAVCTIDIMKYV